MEGTESPRITDEVVEQPQIAEIREEQVIDAAPEIRINGKEQTNEEEKVAPQEEQANPDEQDRLAHPRFKEASPFQETKDKVKYHFKNSKFEDARQLIEGYLGEHNLQEFTIEEQSKVLLRYVLALIKSFHFTKVGEVAHELIAPALLIARNDEAGKVSALARLLYAQQRITTLLAFRD